MTSSSSPSVYIVLLNWNRWQFTVACLESLFRLDYPNYSIIVCDNASTDDSMQKIRDWADGRQVAPLPPTDTLHDLATPPVRKPIGLHELGRSVAESQSRRSRTALTLIQTGANLGFSGGCNVGVRHALAQGADYVWLLNNDTLATRDSLSCLISFVQAHPDVGLCGSTLLSLHRPSRVLALGGGLLRRYTGTTRHIGEGHVWPLSSDDPALREVQRMDYVIGASMLVRRSYLESVGLMDEDYFLYYEELDWAARRPRNVHLGYAPSSVVYHHEGGTTGGLVRSHYYRSLIRFTWRHNRLYLPLVLARMLLRVPEALLRRDRNEVVALFSLVRPRRFTQSG